MWQTPKTNWQANDALTPTVFNRIEGNLQAIEEGSRTVDQTQSPSGLTGSLRQFLDWIPNRIKAILGTTNWYDSPLVTLAGAKNHIDNENNPHSVTAAQVGAATPAQLAAKVDKPSSATSGNIAVFDGGAGKIKDGGKQITDFALNNSIAGNAPVYADSSDVYSDAFGYPNYIELKACKVYMIGTVRIKFDLCAPGGKQLWARIYKNGVAVGTERTTTSTSFTTFTEDIGNMSSGDRLSIYGKHGGSTQSAPALRNFIVSIGGNAPIAEKVL